MLANVSSFVSSHACEVVGGNIEKSLDTDPERRSVSILRWDSGEDSDITSCRRRPSWTCVLTGVSAV